MKKEVCRNSVVIVTTKLPRYQVFTVMDGKALVCGVDSKRAQFRWVNEDDCIVVGMVEKENEFVSEANDERR